MGGEKRPDYDRDLPVLPSNKNEYVVAGYAPILERGLETHFILEVDAHVDREAEPYRGWLYRREWPNVVVKRATILLWMRRIGGEDGGWPAKGLSNIGGSANARFRPRQLSCPNPPPGFSP